MDEHKVRSGRRESFTVLYNSMITDKRLSLKAKGLFAVMMSRPDGWEFSVSGLAKFTGVGKDSIRNILAELERVGYLIREQAHKDNGTFGGNLYILQDMAPPLSGKPDNGEIPLSGNTDDGVIRQRENPSTGFPTQRNTRNNNIPPKAPQGGLRKKREPKTTADWMPEKFEEFWEFYRTRVRKEDRAGAVQEWDKLKPDDALIARIYRALEKQLASDLWKRGVGIPYAIRYLKNRRWEDVEDQPGPSPQPERRSYGWQ